MSTFAVPSILFTPGHVIECSLTEVSEQRLMDMLVNHGTSFLNAVDVKIFGKDGRSLVASLDSAVILKEEICVAMPVAQKHEAPEKRSCAYASKTIANAFVTAMDYEIRGQLQITGTLDPMYYLAREAGEFFPIAAAHVSCAVFSGQRRAQVAIVRRKFVSAMWLSPAESQLPAASPC